MTMTLDLADRNPRSVHRVATALEQMRFFLLFFFTATHVDVLVGS